MSAQQKQAAPTLDLSAIRAQFPILSEKVRGKDLVTYRWGSGDETVLLVHGWRGRVSQFAPLVRELVADGLHVVAFDAPAHGASPSARTDIRDWIAAIEALQLRHGRFRLIAGHSFGALATLTAVRSGTTAARVVTIAGAGTPQVFIDQFAAMIDLSVPAKAAFERSFLAKFGEDAASMRLRFDAIRHRERIVVRIGRELSRDENEAAGFDRVAVRRDWLGSIGQQVVE